MPLNKNQLQTAIRIAGLVITIAAIAFVANATPGARPELFRVPLDQSAPPQRLADWGDGLNSLVWLNDDTIIGIQNIDDSLLRFPAAGGAGTPIEITGDPAPIGRLDCGAADTGRLRR